MKPGGWAYCVMELADDARKVIRESVNSDPAEKQPRPTTDSLNTEYVPRTLASDLRQGRLTAAECISLGLELADALAHLHQRGLLHRDVKPSNIVFVEGVPKLADIGLVAAVREAGSFVGTRGFMPPEGHQDGRGDVFSLGKVLYECAWGRDRLEFPDVPTDAAEWADHGQLMELNEVILKASDPNPALRYASAGEMREELALLKHGKSVRRLRRLEKHWRRVTRIASAAVVLALLAVSGFFFQRHQSRRLQTLADENRDRLVQLQTANGVRMMEEGDFAASALWFSEALKQVAGNPEREWVHRRRLQAVLERSPRLVAIGQHRGRIRAAQFSPDGTVFATAGVDGTVRTWDALTGVATGVVLQHGTPVHDLRFSPDGRWIATAGEDNAARVWNAASGELRFAPLRHEQFVNSVRFSPRGGMLATTSDDHTARIWDAASGRPIGRAFQHDGPVNDAVFGPQEDLLATASDDHTAQVWDVRTGLAVGLRLTHANDVRSVRFSPDGRLVATASKDGAARVWETLTGKPITPPLHHSIPLWTAEFSPDGQRLLAAGGNGDNGGTARVWDLSGVPHTPPMRHGNTIRSAIFSPNGQWIATASHDRSLSLWNASTGTRVGSPFRCSHQMKWVSFSPDGKHLLLAGEDESWRLWDVAGALNITSPLREELPFSLARFSPDGRCILGVTTNQIAVLCDAVSKRVQLTLGEHPDKVVWLAFNRDGRRLLTITRDGDMRVWNTLNGSIVCPPIQLGPIRKDFAEAEFSPDGQTIASVSNSNTDYAVKIWDPGDGGKCRFEFKHAHPAKALAFSPDGSVLLTGSGMGVSGNIGEARLWSTKTGALHAILPHPSTVLLARWSAGGERFLTICHDSSQGQTSARLWDASTRKEIVIPSNKINFPAAAFSPNGRQVAIGADDGEIRIWDSTTAQPLTKPFGHQRACWILQFSSDGRQLVSATAHDPSVRTWESSTGEPLGPALAHGAPVRSISFHPHGDSLLVSGGGRTTLWRFQTSTRSFHELQKLAQLASGCRMDEIAGVVPLSADEMNALLQQTHSW